MAVIPFKLNPSIHLAPGAIEMFATLLHCVYAHSFGNPSPVGDGPHHDAALAYIKAHARQAGVERLGADASSATYNITHPKRPLPLLVKIEIGKSIDCCVSMYATGSRAFVPVDISTIKIVPE